MRKRSEKGMPPPACRAGFEHNVFLFVDDLNQHIDDDAYLRIQLRGVFDSIKKLRKLPNGRIELTTIDESLRLRSNMMDWMKYLPPMKFKKKDE